MQVFAHAVVDFSKVLFRNSPAELNPLPGQFRVLSGILNEQAEEVVAVYHQNGFNLAEKRVIVDWTTLILHKNPLKLG